MIKDIYKSKKPVFSFEIFPPKRNDDIYNIYKTLNQLKNLNPDFISVTYGAGGSNSKKTATIASYIQNVCNIEAIAHLTAISMNREGLMQFLETLRENGVQNVLALRGDRPKDMTDEQYNNRAFSHASDIIQIIREQSELCVAAACYPEIHPESSNQEMDLIHLKEKVDTGADFLITQMFFDNEKFFTFREQAEKHGIQAPISAGIMPITSAKQLGTSVSLSGTSVPAKLSNLVAKYADSPNDLRKAGIDYAIRQINNLLENDVHGIHIYTMNNAATATDIMQGITKEQIR